MTIKKPISAFNYFGGKNNPKLQNFILGNLRFSNKWHLVDVFGGSAAIVLNYRNAKSRTFNDLNSDIYNFFNVLQNNSAELLYKLELSIHCREDYEKAILNETEDSIENARRFFLRTVCSFGNTGSLKSYNSWSYTVNDYRYKVSQSVARLLSKIEGLTEVVEELRKIQIEHLDFRKIIEKYDGPNTIFYLDPPYLKSTRTGNISYKHELSLNDHKDLIKILNKIQGDYLLSGYENELYNKKLKSKSKVQISSCKTNAPKLATEVLWSNYNLDEYKLIFRDINVKEIAK